MENCIGVDDIEFVSAAKIVLEYFSGYASIKNCTFDGTKTDGWVPFILGFSKGETNPTINLENCIFSHFSSFLNVDAAAADYLTFNNCVLFDYDSLFCWSNPFAFPYYNTDPLYCDYENGDYHISTTSFCAPANNFAGELIGAFDPACDLAYTCGDANSDGNVNVSDAVVIINYVFVINAYIPAPLIASDVNCDSKVNVSDAVYIIYYVFSGGDAPCFNCP